MNEAEQTSRRPKVLLDVLVTTVWLFLASLVAGAGWILAGINSAFAGLAVQDASERPISDFFEALVFAPSRLLPPGNLPLTILSTLVWVFVLCSVASLLFHIIRSRVFRHVSQPTPGNA